MFEDRSRDDVARRQLIDESTTGLVVQRRTFSAQRFGEQDPLAGAAVVQGGRVELHELQIRDLSPGSHRQHDPVCGSARRVRRAAPQCAGPTGCDQCRMALETAVRGSDAHASVVGDHEERRGRRDALDVSTSDGVPERAHDLLAGRISPVHAARDGLAAFARTIQLAVGSAVEVAAQLLQPRDRPRSFRADVAHGLLVADPRPCFDRVGGVQVRRVLRPHGGRDPALRQRR